MADNVVSELFARLQIASGYNLIICPHTQESTVRNYLAACLSLLVGTATAQEPEVVFKDVSSDAGLALRGGAACWADLDNDGWVDVCAGAVWKNNAGRSFSRIGEFDPGSVVAADFDNDGFVDLFSWSSLKLLRNNGGTEFVDFPLPELPRLGSRGAVWADFNNDSFVDLYVGGYEGSERSLLILINERGKSFRIERSEGNHATRGVTACDFDQDGDVDIYVSNYRLQPNLLWLNDGNAGFRESASEYGVIATKPGFGGGHSIGASWGDFNNDGLIDLFAGNFAHVDGRGDQPKSRFLKNTGPQNGFRFEDLGTCGVHYQESYASPGVGDFDNDGNLDLFFTTVYAVASFGRKNNPVLFRNNGRFAVQDVTAAAKLDGLPPTYQAAWADYDNDGDLDLATAGRLFQNQGTPHTWLKVRLRGDGKTINRSAIGAQVRVRFGDNTATRQVEAGTGEGNQSQMTLHFGLGVHRDPVDLEVFWPDGRKQSMTDIKTNRLLDVDNSAADR
ncbi:MAG: CRTAC1 family protein [Fuerstiella sp.]